MRKLLFLVSGAVAVATAFSMLSCGGKAAGAEPADNDTDVVADELWLDTIMYAGGHSFGYSGDISMWGGWYFDTTCVGEDMMLTCDSVGPSKLRLGLVTRALVVDLGDPGAEARIKAFMRPIDGFSRHAQTYERCLDSAVVEDYGLIKYMGEFTFIADSPDSGMADREAVNRFICDLAVVSENEKVNLSGLTALYVGTGPGNLYRRVYTGDVNDTQALSDFLAEWAFENWIRGGSFSTGSSAMTVAVRPHIANDGFVTVAKYEYERIGTGHGMYTETFHPLDLKSGKKLTNGDIFMPGTLDRVKRSLYEVMARDPHYLSWHDAVENADQVEAVIKAWRSPNPALEGTEWEEPERDAEISLPDGALTDTGVLFSFQPYEIDCWAAGAYHFVVPYSRLASWLTPEAKRLAGACK